MRVWGWTLGFRVKDSGFGVWVLDLWGVGSGLWCFPEVLGYLLL